MILHDDTPVATTTGFRMTGNQPLVLDGAPRLLVVTSGSLLLYCAEVQEGKQAGPRHLLKRLRAGQAVVALPRRADDRLGLLVVPDQESVLDEVGLQDWFGPEGFDPTCRQHVESWVEALTETLGERELPKLVQRCGEPRSFQVEDSLALCPTRGTVLWVSLEDGTALLRGETLEGLEPGGPPIPLGRNAWIEAHGATRLHTRPSNDLDSPGTAVAGLVRLQDAVLRFLADQQRTERTKELERLRERERIQLERMDLALADIAAVFEPRRPPAPAKTPLLTAATLVGDALGLTVMPPSESQGLRSDPIDAIARASRLRWRRVALNGSWWKRDCGPLLAFSGDEDARPVALIADRRGRYEVYDPEADTRVPLDGEQAARLSPQAVTFYRPLPEGPLRLPDLVRFSLRRRVPDIGYAVLTGALVTVLGMLIPQATALIMDNAVPDSDRRLLFEIGAGLLAVAFGRILFQAAQAFVLVRIGLMAEADGQAALWDRLLRLRPTFFRRFPSGDLQSRVMAVSEVGQKVSGAMLSSLFSGCTTLLNLGLLYHYSPRLTLAACVVAALVVAFVVLIGHYSRKQLRILLDLGGKFFGMVVQLVNGVGKLRVAGASERAFTHWVKRYGEQLAIRSKVQRLSDVQGVFHHALPALSSLVILYLAHGILVESREPGSELSLTLGSFLAFNAAFGTFLGGMIALGTTAVSLQDVVVQGKRIAPILEESPEVDGTKADPGRLLGRVELEDVTFSYGPGQLAILNRVSLHADPGEFVAIVGPSGSGKSTTLRLMLGFEEPAQGRVLYDGQNLASLDVLAVRRQIGVVLQAGKLDAGSIFENIACGNLITLDEAWNAAADAGIADEIRMMPMGMHTVVSVGGGNLSGGQRQRLLIARALVQRHRVLFFDEATSALDNNAQRVVSESLDKLRATRIVIAHRMSTIRNADRIYVLDGGSVVQSGTFESLMAERDGLFARMMARQMV